MKILPSIAYLIAFGLLMFIQYRQQRWQVAGLLSGRRGNLRNFAVGVFTLFILFIQFWLLTDIFPTDL